MHTLRKYQMTITANESSLFGGGAFPLWLFMREIRNGSSPFPKTAFIHAKRRSRRRQGVFVVNQFERNLTSNMSSCDIREQIDATVSSFSLPLLNIYSRACVETSRRKFLENENNVYKKYIMKIFWFVDSELGETRASRNVKKKAKFL